MIKRNLERLTGLSPNPSKNSNRGFSMVEVLIAAVILTIVMGAVIGVLVSTTDFYESTTADTDLFNNGQIAMDRIKTELTSLYRNDTAVLAVTDNTSEFRIDYNPGVGWDTNNNRPKFQVDPPDSSNMPRSFVWDKAAGTLTFNSTGDPSFVVCNDVTAFNFFSDTETRFFVFLTVGRRVQTSGEFNTIERGFRHILYVLEY